MTGFFDVTAIDCLVAICVTSHVEAWQSYSWSTALKTSNMYTRSACMTCGYASSEQRERFVPFRLLFARPLIYADKLMLRSFQHAAAPELL
jgi:hypothetical protein